MLFVSTAAGRLVVAAALPQNNASPGGIAVIAIEGKQSTRLFGRRQVMTISEGNLRWAIVGLSLDIAPGQYILSSSLATQNPVAFAVYPHHFGYFQTDDHPAAGLLDSKVDPKALQVALSLPRSKQTTNRPLFPFQAPVAGSEILPFGTWLFRDVDAGIQSNSVKYLADTPRVSSPGDGVIYATVIRKDGMSVIIDHGNGLISVIYPLEPIAIKPYQPVRRGQVLGRTMKRKSGISYLHWMALLNGNWVNPTLLLLPG